MLGRNEIHKSNIARYETFNFSGSRIEGNIGDHATVNCLKDIIISGKIGRYVTLTSESITLLKAAEDFTKINGNGDVTALELGRYVEVDCTKSFKCSNIIGDHSKIKSQGSFEIHNTGRYVEIETLASGNFTGTVGEHCKVNSEGTLTFLGDVGNYVDIKCKEMPVFKGTVGRDVTVNGNKISCTHNADEKSQSGAKSVIKSNDIEIHFNSDDNVVTVIKSGVSRYFHGKNAELRTDRILNQILIDDKEVLPSDPREIPADQYKALPIPDTFVFDGKTDIDVSASKDNFSLNSGGITAIGVKGNAVVTKNSNLNISVTGNIFRAIGTQSSTKDMKDDFTEELKQYLNTFTGKTKNSKLIEELKFTSAELNVIAKSLGNNIVGIPNIPVRLNGNVYDFAALNELSLSSNLDPVTRTPYFLRDIKPAVYVQKLIETKIAKIKEVRLASSSGSSKTESVVYAPGGPR